MARWNIGVKYLWGMLRGVNVGTYARATSMRKPAPAITLRRILESPREERWGYSGLANPSLSGHVELVVD